MAFSISPAVTTTEADLTTIIPTVSTTAGGLAGLFRWGPVGQLSLISSVPQLVKQYGAPSNYNAETFFTAYNFLAYGNQLYVSRAANTTDVTANGTFTAIADSSNTIATYVANSSYLGTNVAVTFNIKNQDDFNTKLANGQFAGQSSYLFAAQYPGAIGSSLQVSVCDTPAAYSSNLVNVSNTAFVVSTNTATVSFTDSNTTILAATNAQSLSSYTAWAALTPGDFLTVGNSTVGFQKLQLSNKGTAPVFVATTGTLANSSNVVTGITNTSGITVGSLVVANVAGMPAGTTVDSVVNSTAVQLSSAFGGTSGSANVNFAQETLNLSFYNNYTLATAVSMSGNIQRNWQYASSVTAAPGTSTYMTKYGNAAAIDEVHVVVTDALGLFTNAPGTILEVYQGLSRATNAQTPSGQTNYYQNVLNQGSQYIYCTNPRGGTSYVNTAVNMTSLTTNSYNVPLTLQFAGGQDGFSEANTGTNIGTITAAYDLFNSTESVSISLLMTGKSDDTNGALLGNYLIQNIAQVRNDCIVFVSPTRASVVSNVNNELNSVTAFRNSIVASSYGVMDSGYKYQYDQYNDLYRYVPLNGDIAGLCVYTDNTKDPWWSPAGFNRGVIKNVIKLAYNPKKADRDVLYDAGVNPVVSFPGKGTVLMGDKTLQPKASAFNRINVRRLFIVLEKTIAQAAQYSLFEFNDQFTRQAFVNMVTPYLKDVLGRRGITAFKVVCDTTNNTEQVINSNQFVGDIYIQPNYSINFIQLNFTAVSNGVSFNEIAG